MGALGQNVPWEKIFESCPLFGTMVKTWIQPILFATKEFSTGIFLRHQEKIAHHVFEIISRGFFRVTLPQKSLHVQNQYKNSHSLSFDLIKFH